MSEHKHYKLELVKVPKKWKERAYIDKDEYQKLYRKSVENPDKFWGKEGKRLDWIRPYTPRQERLVRLSRRLDQMVRGRHPQRRRQLHRPASEEARQADRHHLGARRPRASEAHHLSRAAQGRLPLGQRAEGERGQARRPGDDLSADDPGSGLRHARLRADRRHPFRRVRRLLAGLAGRAHRGLQIDAS